MSPSEKSTARPMSDERLEELRRLVGIGRGVMDLATLDCIAEIYRLRDALTGMRATAIHYAIDVLSYAGHTEAALQRERGLVESAQAILTACMRPDGISEREAIKQLLELLDGPLQREVKAKVDAAIAKATGKDGGQP